MATINWNKEWENLEKLVGSYLSHLLKDANKQVMVTKKTRVVEDGQIKEKKEKVECTLWRAIKIKKINMKAEVVKERDLLWGKKMLTMLAIYVNLGIVDGNSIEFFNKIRKAGEDAVRAHEHQKGVTVTEASLNKIRDVAEIKKLQEEIKTIADAFRARMHGDKDLAKSRLEAINTKLLQSQDFKEIAKDLTLRRGNEGTMWLKFLRALDGLLQKMGFSPIGITGVKVVKGLRQFEKRIKQSEDKKPKELDHANRASYTKKQ